MMNAWNQTASALHDWYKIYLFIHRQRVISIGSGSVTGHGFEIVGIREGDRDLPSCFGVHKPPNNTMELVSSVTGRQGMTEVHTGRTLARRPRERKV